MKDLKIKILFFTQLLILEKKIKYIESWKNGTVYKVCLYKIIFLFYYHSFVYKLWLLHSNPSIPRPVVMIDPTLSSQSSATHVPSQPFCEADRVDYYIF